MFHLTKFFRCSTPLKCIPKYPNTLFASKPLFLFASSTKDADLANILSEISLGKDALKHHKLDNSLEYYRRALEAINSSKEALPTLQEQAALKFEVYRGLAGAYKKKSQIPEAIKHFEEAINFVKSGDIIDTKELAGIYNEIAHGYLEQSKLKEAGSYLEKAKALITANNKDKGLTPQLVDNIYTTALMHARDEQFDRAQELLSDLLIKLQKAPADFKGQNFELFHVYLSLGNLALRDGDNTKALHYWNKGADLVRSRYGQVSFHLIPFNEKMIELDFSEGKYEEVILNTERNLFLCEAHYPEHHPELAKNYFMLGLACYEQGDLNKALESYKKALNIFVQHPKQFYEEITYSYLAIAQIYFAEKDHENAALSYEKGLKFSLETLGNEHPRLAEYYLFWTDLLKQQNRGKESKEYLQKALDIYLKGEEKDLEVIADIYRDLGESLYTEGEYEQSIKCYEECLKSLEGTHVDIKIKEKVNNSIGLAYFQQQKYEDSEKYFKKALELCKRSTEHKDLDVYFRNLALSFENRGMQQEAIENFNKALDLAEKNFGKKAKITREYFEILVDRYARVEKFDDIEKLRTRFVDLS